MSELAVHRPGETAPAVIGFGSLAGLAVLEKAAELLSSSTMVPAAYQAVVYGRNGEAKGQNPAAKGNCIVALNMAQRMHTDPLMVMQNLHVIEGRPSWSSQWIIAALNASGRFSPLEWRVTSIGPRKAVHTSWGWGEQRGEKVAKTETVEIEDVEWVCFATEIRTGKVIHGPAVTLSMAVAEGWYTKNGSKWKTMPDMMGRYRSAAFFGRLYAPEILSGLLSVEEAHDILEATPDERGQFSVAQQAPAAAPMPARRSAAVDVQPRTEAPAAAPARRSAHPPQATEPSPPAAEPAPAPPHGAASQQSEAAAPPAAEGATGEPINPGQRKWIAQRIAALGLAPERSAAILAAAGVSNLDADTILASQFAAIRTALSQEA